MTVNPLGALRAARGRWPVKRGEGGFTLVELLVAIFIFAIVTAVAFSAVWQFSSVATYANTEFTTTNNTNVTVGLLNNYLEGAAYPAAPSAPAWAVALDTPIAIACPDEVLFWGASPSGNYQAGSYGWTFIWLSPYNPAKIVPVPTTGNGFSSFELYQLKAVFFPSGNGTAATLYDATNSGSSCPTTAPSPTPRSGTSITNLSDVALPQGSYNALPANSSSVFSYVSGNPGSTNQYVWMGQPGYVAQSVVGIAIRLNVSPTPGYPITVTSTQDAMQLSAVTSNSGLCALQDLAVSWCPSSG